MKWKEQKSKEKNWKWREKKQTENDDESFFILLKVLSNFYYYMINAPLLKALFQQHKHIFLSLVLSKSFCC